MGKLTYKKRQKLPKSVFAIPEERAYPIHDLPHARNALARVSAFGSPKEQRRVRLEVYRRYPQLREKEGEMMKRLPKRKKFGGKVYELAGMEPTKSKREAEAWAEFQRRENRLDVKVVRALGGKGYEIYIRRGERREAYEKSLRLTPPTPRISPKPPRLTPKMKRIS